MSAHTQHQNIWQRLHIDLPLLLGLFAVMGFGLFVIYSASGEDLGMMERQLFRMVLSLVIMFIMAQINPEALKRWALPIYLAGIVLLLGVHFFGEINKGAQRWLNLGFMEFQPSELIKLAFPITMAWYISKFQLPLKSAIWRELESFYLYLRYLSQNNPILEHPFWLPLQAYSYCFYRA